MEVPVLEELLLLHFCLFPAQCRNEHRLSAVLGHSLYFCQWDTRVALFSDGHEVWGAAKTLRPSPPLYEWPTWDLGPTLRPLCRAHQRGFSIKDNSFHTSFKRKRNKDSDEYWYHWYHCNVSWNTLLCSFSLPRGVHCTDDPHDYNNYLQIFRRGNCDGRHCFVSNSSCTALILFLMISNNADCQWL